MAWSWSHSPEAHQNVRENLENKPLEWLQVCVAEICAASTDDGASYHFDNGVYYKTLAQIEANDTTESESIGIIWSFANTYKTCDNGGFNAWCCPFGCHTVSFSKEGEV